MRLIGLLDSPYVRRVAVSMHLLGLPFEHRQLSVFRDFEAFRRINPLVKVPTLVTPNGTMLVDSTLILDWLEAQAKPGRSLVPARAAERERSLALLGICLVALEKAVSLLYERTQRPVRLQHPGWIERNRLQLQSACEMLEQALDGVDGWLLGERPLQLDVTLAVTWTFIQRRTPEDVTLDAFPALANWTRRAEKDPAFKRYPFPAR